MPQLGTQNFSSQSTRPQISKFTTKTVDFDPDEKSHEIHVGMLDHHR